MLPFFLQSLREHSSLDDVILHFVDKGCSEKVRLFLQSIESQSILIHRLDKKWDEFSATDRGGIPNMADDCAGTCEWMMDNCGSTEWCYISHFDMEFKSDLLGMYRVVAGDLDGCVGQVGAHRLGLVGYRREAVKQSMVGFGHFASFCLVKDYRGRWIMRHVDDKRISHKDIPIHHFDVGELLELVIAAKKWSIECPVTEFDHSLFYHLGTGSGHCGDPILKRDEALAILKRRNLSIIE